MFQSDTLDTHRLGPFFKSNLVHKCKGHCLRVSPARARLFLFHFDKVCPKPATLLPPPPSAGSMQAACIPLGSARSKPQQEIRGWKERVARASVLPAPLCQAIYRSHSSGGQAHVATALSSVIVPFPHAFRSVVIPNSSHFSVESFM